MSKTERVAMLQNKAQELINWFEGKELPTSTVKTQPGVYIMDARLFYEYQVSIIEGYKGNPYSRVFVSAYNNLSSLKTIMDVVEGK